MYSQLQDEIRTLKREIHNYSISLANENKHYTPLYHWNNNLHPILGRIDKYLFYIIMMRNVMSHLNPFRKNIINS